MDITIAYQRAIQIYQHKYLALYHALRDGILSGSLASGTRLPSTRELAKTYGLSRGSVSEAYDMLLAEGYTESAVGKGTFVIEQPITATNIGEIEAQSNIHSDTPLPSLSVWGQRVVQLEQEIIMSRTHRSESISSLTFTSKLNNTFSISTAESPELISFQSGEILLEGSSQASWKSALSAAGKDLQKSAIDSLVASVQGDIWLREAICNHVGRTRGITATPEQVVLCSGSMEVIALLCQLLINEQDTVILENPCYSGIRRAITAWGGHIEPAPLDQHGIIPQDWNAQLLFVTPGRQFPTGSVLPLARRQQLLQWAISRGAWIIEDDYDSEFRWSGRPIEPLKALDDKDCVVYVGSFSKSMFSSLRLGYAILPTVLAEALTAAKRLYDPLPPARLEQRALARFMIRGDYIRHLRRMTRRYRSRYDVFQQAIQDHQLHELFDFQQTDCGLHAYATWKHDSTSYDNWMKIARNHEVIWRDAVDYQLTPSAPSACFIFAHLPESHIIEGITRLRQSWDHMQQND